jgi:nicotinamide-nucleotide amidase
MQAAIVTIGDELLIGQVVDTNSVYIGKQLEAIGCSVAEKVAISDDYNVILQTLKRYQNCVDLVVITGGLGPTKDDVTKKAFASYFNDELVLNNDVYVHVKQLIEGIYKKPISEINKLQAYVPSKCSVLFNDVGTAPAMLMRNEQTVYISLPGVPFEMKYLIDNKVIPYIHQNFNLKAIVHTTVITAGIGESLLAEIIESWEDSLKPLNIYLSYLPKFGLVQLRLSKIGDDKVLIKNEIDQKIVELNDIIPEYFVGISNNESLLEEVNNLLIENKLTITTAESCTGGSIAKLLSSIPGSSNYYKGSAVTYATSSKVDVLKVNQTTINQYTVVSEAVAKEMVLGVQKLYKSNIAVSTTGNAGPSKGDSDVPVGTVCIGLAIDDEVETFTFNFGQPREKVIEATIAKVWFILYQKLKKYKKSKLM